MKKLYWAPGSIWKIKDNILWIDNLKFHESSQKLFPEFYFLTVDGIREEDLIRSFPGFRNDELKQFVDRLKKHGILSDRMQEVSGIFRRQSLLLNSGDSLPEGYFLEEENIAQWRKKSCERQVVGGENGLSVDCPEKDPVFGHRRSCRSFDRKRLVLQKDFFALLSVMASDAGGQYPQYAYPSAGGLYPIDIYIHVKEGRIEGVGEGIYYFRPDTKRLVLVPEGVQVTKDHHFFLNKRIFETSAFSIHLVYNAEVSVPKYRDRAVFYGMIDAGILTGYLHLMAQKTGLACCSIGELRKGIRDNLQLKDHQIYLHTIEMGYPESGLPE